jgi:hypothetical protein
MFLQENSFRAHSTTMQGIQYNVFSFYSGTESIRERIGKMIEDAFQVAEAVEITNPSLVDNFGIRRIATS